MIGDPVDSPSAVPIAQTCPLACEWRRNTDHSRGPQAVSAYPPGITYVPQVNRVRPFQARFTWQGRRYSIGYFRSVLEAELALNRIRREAAEWAEMQLPPPTLQRVLARRAQPAMPSPPVAPADGMPAVEPMPAPQRSGSPSSPLV